MKVMTTQTPSKPMFKKENGKPVLLSFLTVVSLRLDGEMKGLVASLGGLIN